VPAFDHCPRCKEFLKREVTELEELYQPAILYVVPCHHQQAAAIFNAVDEFIYGAFNVTEFRR
jgi:hypothetical protein